MLIYFYFLLGFLLKHPTPRLPQGLGFPTISVQGIPPPFTKMVEEGLVDEPVFSFWLNRNAKEDLGGLLTFGGVNPDYFEGEHKWVDLSLAGYW